MDHEDELLILRMLLSFEMSASLLFGSVVAGQRHAFGIITMSLAPGLPQDLQSGWAEGPAG